MAKMQLRMCASSASAPLADASATEGREVREEGGAQGNWASEEGLKHSKKVSWRARSVTPAMPHRDGKHAKKHVPCGKLGCTDKTSEGDRHAVETEHCCHHVEGNPPSAPASRQRLKVWLQCVEFQQRHASPLCCHLHLPTRQKALQECT